MLFINGMCQLRQHVVRKIKDKTVYLKDGIKAFYDKKIGIIKPNDRVLVYGNLVLSKVITPNQSVRGFAQNRAQKYEKPTN